MLPFASNTRSSMQLDVPDGYLYDRSIWLPQKRRGTFRS